MSNNQDKQKKISRTEPQSNNTQIQQRKNCKISIFSNNKTNINPNKKIKKTITTYNNKLNNRKFDSNKFQEYLKGVYDYEQRKQEKIENMRKQKQEKELKKVTYYPKINKESNLKFKVNPKKYSTIERLYTQDLIKRKEKK